ncbi:hypothetical protein FXO38_19971 [Capsicum annuum]|nr:hypothetical protein FXO38_19971 [Capsicum annuum]KAF3646624.1 hypothetical protein FXO37_20363 [Capsicum annuum]
MDIFPPSSLKKTNSSDIQGNHNLQATEKTSNIKSINSINTFPLLKPPWTKNKHPSNQHTPLPELSNVLTTKQHNHQSNDGTPLLCNHSNAAGPPTSIVDEKSLGGKMNTAQDNGGITTYSHLPSRPSRLSPDSKGNNRSNSAGTGGRSLEINNSLDTTARISTSELHGGGQCVDDLDIPKYTIYADHSIPLKQPVTQLHTNEPDSPITVNSNGKGKRPRKRNIIDSRGIETKQQRNVKLLTHLWGNKARTIPPGQDSS